MATFTVDASMAVFEAPRWTTTAMSCDDDVTSAPWPGVNVALSNVGRSGFLTKRQLSVENCPQKPASRGVGSRKKFESGMSSGLSDGSLMSTNCSGLTTYV